MPQISNLMPFNHEAPQPPAQAEEYTMMKSFQMLIQPPTRPTLVGRWDWHAWNFFVALLPALFVAGIAQYARADMARREAEKQEEERLATEQALHAVLFGKDTPAQPGAMPDVKTTQPASDIQALGAEQEQLRTRVEQLEAMLQRVLRGGAGGSSLQGEIAKDDSGTAEKPANARQSQPRPSGSSTPRGSMDTTETCKIELPEQPMDCHFHPTEPLIATGIISGRLQTYRYAGSTAERVLSLKAHSESCRAVQFSAAGSLLLSASADKSILAVDVAQGVAKARLSDAHAVAINRLTMVSETVLASGDDSGCINLWDTRQQSGCGSFQAHSDFITDMVVLDAHQSLLAVSGDGTLSVNDLRTIKVQLQTEDDADDELLSVAVVKQGKKVVCGSQSGVINLYTWGAMADCSDRFPGHPSSVDALLKYDEDTIITGSSDGLIRILSILPNKMLGIIGAHNDDPIERLAMSADRSMLASASHDNTLRLWDVAYLGEDDDEEEEARQANEDDKEEEEKDSDGSDDDDTAGKRRKKKQRQKKGSGKIPKASKHRASASGFFADLVQS
ncbi:hypothetical protein WJX72_005787 [[Myrmecia] bisecta]|uniref:Uncharacterized protein n=1 Tax=[Myrmecia] bisecta TaxID=41462 RepID=A0AAW1QQU1_9CHLO